MNNFFLFFVKSILLSLEINFIYSQCDRDRPFLKNEQQCESSCTREEINNNICKINNEIVKTQYLNNIIFIKNSNFYYISIHTSVNNNLYYLVSCYPKTNERVMYILNNEGYGYYNKTNPLIDIFIDDPIQQGKYESEIFTVQFPENNGREYLVSIGKAPQYVELYDLYENNIYYNNVTETFGHISGVRSKEAPIFKLYPNENRNEYLIGLLSSVYNSDYTKNYYFYLIKANFTSMDVKNNPPTSITQRVQCSDVYIVSCFRTDNNYIMCFYSNPNYQYTIIVYNYNLTELTNIQVAYGRSNQDSEELFFKCIHFFQEAGVFVYFNDQYIPVFLFKQYSNNLISDVYTTVSDIRLNNYYFNRKKVATCDILKVEDKKFYFAGVSINRDKIYIISFINYKDDKFVYKIFSIDKQIYNYDFAEYVKTEIYYNFLVLGSNYYEVPGANRTSFLIIFSYPNTTEVDIDLDDYLSKNNDTKINNLTLELNGEYIIDNNIFGYIYSGVQIIENCMDVNDIYIADINEIKIVNNYFLPNNKKIILKIPKSENYEPFICKIKYAAVVMEPEYFQYNQYPIDIAYVGDLEDSGDEETFYNNNKKNYVGKYSFYNFILKNKLTAINCEDTNCELCYYNNKAECITYMDVINVAITEDTNTIDSNSINSNLIDTNSVEHTNPIDTNFIDANTLANSFNNFFS